MNKTVRSTRLCERSEAIQLNTFSGLPRPPDRVRGPRNDPSYFWTELAGLEPTPL